jgi:UDP-2,3-diacylglucosamine pyrophosphatase LpxH
MPKSRIAVARHRTLWISDVHLGSPGCKARALTEFLRRNDAETLYLVGDIFDGWKMKSKFYWTPDHSRVIKQIITKARKGTKVYYLTGNHDDFMRQFVRSQLPLGRVRLSNEIVHTTADGRRLLVLHGDQFDEVVSGYPTLAFAGDVAYEGLMKVSDRLSDLGARLGFGRWSLSAFAKTKVKAAVQWLSGFDEKVMFRCRRNDLQGVICGHTHHAEVRELRHGIVSYNCGDWVESCTGLTEDFNGHIRILSYEELQRTPRIAPEPALETPIGDVVRRLPRVAARVRRRAARAVRVVESVAAGVPDPAVARLAQQARSRVAAAPHRDVRSGRRI